MVVVPVVIHEGRVVRILIFKAGSGTLFLVLVLKFAASKKVVPVMKYTPRLVPVLILHDLLVPALKYWQAVLVVILRQGVVLVLIFAE